MPLFRRAAAALTLSATLPLAALTGCAVVALSAPAHAQSASSRYGNLVNDRFATVSSGPQSSLVVDAPGGATDATVREQVGRVARREWETKSRALSSQMARMEAAGVVRPGAILPLSSVVTVRKQGRLVVPPRLKTRAVGGGTLTFRYTGFNDTDRQLLEDFVTIAYPRLVAVYGQPSQTAEVEVVNAGDLASTQIPETRRFAYGVYDRSANRILLPLFRDPRGTLQAFLLTMTHAFHGPATFDYDAWEQGFARAAASVVLRDPIFAQRYGIDDASANTLLSLLRYYDVLNQPALSNPTFFPPSQVNIPIDGQLTVAKMLWARMGMSGGAWLKVYIENQNFFRQFNEAYYTQFDSAAQPSLAGNVPALRAIAAPLVANGVEGISWDNWFTRQYILDSSIAPGTKLFAFAIPASRDAEGRQNNSVTLVYYRTERTGDETLLDGRAYATYLDGENNRLQLGPQAEQAVITNGEGALTATTQNSAGTDATLLNLSFAVGNQTAQTYLPIGFDGDFQGVLLGNGPAQAISIQQVSLPPVQNRTQNATFERKAFGATLATGGNELGVTIVSVSDGTASRSFRINTGDGSYYAILRDGTKGGAPRNASKTFDSSTVPYLISPPVRPFSTDIAAAINVPSSDFLLSYWNPLHSGGAGYETFAVGRPSVEPIQPGRGYWLKLSPLNNAPQVVVSMNGTAPPTDSSFTIGCSFGWNLVGSPFDTPIPLSDVRVQLLQNDAFTWDEAVSRNLVAAQPFAFDTVTGTYRPVDGFGGEWEGYWLRVLSPSGVTLLLPGPDVPPASRAMGRATSRATFTAGRPDWAVRLTARQDITVLRGPQAVAAGVSTVTLGAGRGATRSIDNRFDRELPPAIVPGVSAEFGGTKGTVSRAAGGRYVTDIRDSYSAGRGTWEVLVTTPENGNATLTWDGMGGVPRSTRLFLEDTKTGKRVALASRSSYSYTSEAGQTRAFRVIAEAGRTAPLAITNILTTGGGASRATGGGVSVVYNITGPAAETILEVSALNGNVVRRVSGGRAETAGLRRVLFDGRAQSGSALPPGPYILTLTARDDDGTVVKATRMMTLLQ